MELRDIIQSTVQRQASLGKETKKIHISLNANNILNDGSSGEKYLKAFAGLPVEVYASKDVSFILEGRNRKAAGMNFSIRYRVNVDESGKMSLPS